MPYNNKFDERTGLPPVLAPSNDDISTNSDYESSYNNNAHSDMIKNQDLYAWSNQHTSDSNLTRTDIASPSSSIESSSDKLDSNRRSLYVGNLSPTVTWAQMHKLFSPYGTILRCKLSVDKATGHNVGYGFVEYENSDSVPKAINALHDYMLIDRKVKVAPALPPKSEKDPGQTNLYVSNLPPSYTRDDILALFTPYGQIIGSRLLVNPNGSSRGVGFVRLDCNQNAVRAIEAIDNTIPKGATTPISVKLAAESTNVRKNQDDKSQGFVNTPDLAAYNQWINFYPFTTPTLAISPQALSPSMPNQTLTNISPIAPVSTLMPVSMNVQSMPVQAISLLPVMPLANAMQINPAQQQQQPVQNKVLPSHMKTNTSNSTMNHSQSQSQQNISQVPQQHLQQVIQTNSPSLHQQQPQTQIATNAASQSSQLQQLSSTMQQLASSLDKLAIQSQSTMTGVDLLHDGNATQLLSSPTSSSQPSQQSQSPDKNKSYALTNIYVSSLPLHYGKDELNRLFEPYGRIIGSRVLTDRNGNSRGIGFVRLDTHANAKNSIACLDGKVPQFGTVPLICRFAHETKNVNRQPMQQIQVPLQSVQTSMNQNMNNINVSQSMNPNMNVNSNMNQNNLNNMNSMNSHMQMNVNSLNGTPIHPSLYRSMQLNQLNQMNQMNQMNHQINQMNQLNQLNQMNQMNQLGQMGTNMQTLTNVLNMNGINGF